jgi:hypothetical protein
MKPAGVHPVAICVADARQRVELPDEAVASAIEEVKKLTGAERDRHKE